MATATKIRTQDQLVPRGKRGGPIVKGPDDAMRLWAEGLTTCAARVSSSGNGYDRPSMARSSIIVERDSIYHYGYHFKLAHIDRSPTGRPRMVWINVEKYHGSGGFGVSTSGRQCEILGLVRRSGLPYAQIDLSRQSRRCAVLDTRAGATLTRRTIPRIVTRRPTIDEIAQHGRYMGALRARASGIEAWPAMDAAIAAGSPLRTTGDRIARTVQTSVTELIYHHPRWPRWPIETFTGNNRPKTIDEAFYQLGIGDPV